MCLYQEIVSQCWKLRLFLFNVSCCLAAAYFFRRHNKFCEPGSECSSVSFSPMMFCNSNFLFVVFNLQSTHSSPYLSIWWSSPIWPST